MPARGARVKLDELPPMPPDERVKFEYEIQGAQPSGHGRPQGGQQFTCVLERSMPRKTHTHHTFFHFMWLQASVPHA